ncbi:hypothetical protein DL345_07015 [Citrobacter koseri]|nr:hypothetical protein DL345_07015 [Citrobacter koseri]
MLVIYTHILCVSSNLLKIKDVFPVLKTGDPKGFQSSNLCASARLNKGLPKGSPFVFVSKNIVSRFFQIMPNPG